MYLDDANIRNADAEIAQFESPLKSIVKVSEFASIKAAMEYETNQKWRAQILFLAPQQKVVMLLKDLLVMFKNMLKMLKI